MDILTIAGLVILVAIAIGLIFTWRTQVKERKKYSSKYYRSLTTYPQKRGAVDRSKSIHELETMWSAWEKQGFSTEGLLYADILQKKAELGATLSAEEESRISAADAARRRAKKLPPIRGRRT